MLLGCIADDFTGASDLANTLAKGGMQTVQFIGVPGEDEEATCEAGVIALKTRSSPAAEAVTTSLEALGWLERQGCTQYLFKYCSTFDSTPEGNIGPVAIALLDALCAKAAIVCPVFPATGRTLYLGHLFVQDHLLSESGMQHHPLNPMTDPDIRRWLRRQTSEETVGHVPHQFVRQGGAALATALHGEASKGRRLVVVDALTEDDLLTIGGAVAAQKLITGGSGIALGLPANFRAAGLLRQAAAAFEPTHGPGVVLTGSCSVASAAQLAFHLQKRPGFRIEPDLLMNGQQTVEEVSALVRQRLRDEPIVFSTAEFAELSAAQSRHGRERLAHTLEEFFGDLARHLVAAGVTRLVVGGGETSGAVVTALGIKQLKIGPEIDPGVPALSGDGQLRLALKSGNFGSVDFYEKALATLGAP